MNVKLNILLRVERIRELQRAHAGFLDQTREHGRSTAAAGGLNVVPEYTTAHDRSVFGSVWGCSSACEIAGAQSLWATHSHGCSKGRDGQNS